MGTYKNDSQKYINNVEIYFRSAVYHQFEAKKQIKRIIAQWINGEIKKVIVWF